MDITTTRLIHAGQIKLDETCEPLIWTATNKDELEREGWLHPDALANNPDVKWFVGKGKYFTYHLATEINADGNRYSLLYVDADENPYELPIATIHEHFTALNIRYLSCSYPDGSGNVMPFYDYARLLPIHADRMLYPAR